MNSIHIPKKDNSMFKKLVVTYSNGFQLVCEYVHGILNENITILYMSEHTAKWPIKIYFVWPTCHTKSTPYFAHCYYKHDHYN